MQWQPISFHSGAKRWRKLRKSQCIELDSEHSGRSNFELGHERVRDTIEDASGPAPSALADLRASLGVTRLLLSGPVQQKGRCRLVP